MMYLSIFFICLAGCVLTLALSRRQRNRAQVEIVPGPMLGALTAPMAYMIPIREKGAETLRRELVRAGRLHESALVNYLAARNVILCSWAIFATSMFALELIEPTNINTIGAGIITILLFGIPRLWLGMKASNRTQSICHELPDALDLLAMMMSGGMTMKDSLNHVIGEFDSSHPELAGELRITARHANTGSLDCALMAFAERLDTAEVTSLTAMLRGGHHAGGSLVESLRDFADGLRYSRDQKAKERGNTASIKLLMPVVFFLAPPIYILLLGPAFLNLKDFVEKENRPGGALAPAVQASEMAPEVARNSNALIGRASQNR